MQGIISLSPDAIRRPGWDFPGFIWHRTHTLQQTVIRLDKLTVEQIIAFHDQVMKADGGDDRLLSEATLHQMVFLANRIDDSYQRAALVFYSLIAYPAFREGNSLTARLVAEMILNNGGCSIIKESEEGIADLVQGITSFTLEMEDIEAWLHSHAKKVSGTE